MEDVRLMGQSEILTHMRSIARADGTAALEVKDCGMDFLSALIKKEKQQFPYSALAQDGVIDYNGVCFVGDAKSNSLCLGDMSDYRKILNIQLSDGGLLKVNTDNLEDLRKSIGLFSTRDQALILKAICAYHHQKGVENSKEFLKSSELNQIANRAN